MQVTDDLIRNVVQEVLTHMRPVKGKPTSNGVAKTSGRWGVFDDVQEAVAACAKSQREFEKRGLADRKKAVDCIRKICVEQAETLGRLEFEETRIGRLVHKI